MVLIFFTEAYWMKYWFIKKMLIIKWAYFQLFKKIKKNIQCLILKNTRKQGLASRP